MRVLFIFGQVSSTTVSAAKRRQILTAENVLRGIYENDSDPEEEIIAEQQDEDEKDEQKWLCLMLLIF